MPLMTVKTFALGMILGATVWGLGRDGRSPLETDWLWQWDYREQQMAKPTEAVSRAQDAAGGCDGVLTGGFGFHTENEENPWWQVDLGQTRSLTKLVAYNREDLAERTARLQVLVSRDGETFQQVYQHDGRVFYGHTRASPLCVHFDAPIKARMVRLQLPGRSYFHLDEVEVYAAGQTRNLALNRPATQSSISQWSSSAAPASGTAVAQAQVRRGLALAHDLQARGAEVTASIRGLKRLARDLQRSEPAPDRQQARRDYLQARQMIRPMALAEPLLDFDTLLFVKRRPGSLPHLSDQYYGWWSRPGGGVYLLSNFKDDRPEVTCLTDRWPAGNFLRPDLSYDGKRVLFAYCRHYPGLHDRNKVDKDSLPEDAFYQIYEMDLDGTNVRRLTHGRYDDFDARYMPDGDILFLSTRKGCFLQCTQHHTARTLTATLPDSYVRCGGDNIRPCPVFTLHAMNAEGGDMRPLSAFETFEYTPALANDGRILYCRWDYIDRFNGHFFSLWSAGQDGFNPQLVYGNYTQAPQATLEPRPIPGSDKLVFTAGAHHSITGGSLVLFDRTRGTEGEIPITRLTPEVPFPETEKNIDMYYANPYPLSEDVYLVSCSNRSLPGHTVGQAKRGEVTEQINPGNAQGLYLYHRSGHLELLYRDPTISCMYPLPVRPRTLPPVAPVRTDWRGPQRGAFLLQDVYRGLDGVRRGTVKSLRLIGVPPKTQPHMNTPCIGVSDEDPGKYVLGTVPVTADGSAYFKVPSGIPVFFQALDAEGMAVQTMRSLTYVMPGQTLSCVGCHESRQQTPPSQSPPLALQRGPSPITPAPEGAWPLRFDRLVQPILDRACVQCHRPESETWQAHQLDLTPKRAYEALINHADRELYHLAFEKDRSVVNDSPARQSRLLQVLREGKQHRDVPLSRMDRDRLVTWMDTYAQRLGSFSTQQETELVALRHRLADLFVE
jgi:hypothetical protein